MPLQKVFPARAGMSPLYQNHLSEGKSVPRASGDEPGDPNVTQSGYMCSPRERG